jgi:S-adenosylmethionine decarboxylase
MISFLGSAKISGLKKEDGFVFKLTQMNIFPAFKTNMSFQPGTHIIASLQTDTVSVLQTFCAFEKRCNELIERHALQKLGEVYHNFQPQGFTGVVCLSESHLSVHTFPEYSRANLDIYLSNYLRDNDGTVTEIYQSLVSFFEATIIEERRLKR